MSGFQGGLALGVVLGTIFGALLFFSIGNHKFDDSVKFGNFDRAILNSNINNSVINKANKTPFKEIQVILKPDTSNIRSPIRRPNDAKGVIAKFDDLKSKETTRTENNPKNENLHSHQSKSTIASTTAVTSTVASTIESSNGRVSRSLCKFKYGRREFLPETARRLPPMLYTFPGSGNTWSRLLIEYSTGILSGSVYNDRSLLEELPGEFTCSWTVSVVKVHLSQRSSSTFNSLPQRYYPQFAF